jgi:hypothetical protein
MYSKVGIENGMREQFQVGTVIYLAMLDMYMIYHVNMILSSSFFSKTPSYAKLLDPGDLKLSVKMNVK